jgi:hypothetical protein
MKHVFKLSWEKSYLVPEIFWEAVKYRLDIERSLPQNSELAQVPPAFNFFQIVACLITLHQVALNITLAKMN